MERKARVKLYMANKGGVMNRSSWSREEKKYLIKNYRTSTIQELKEIFAKKFSIRSSDSINAEIKRLKKSGDIEGYKDDETVNRSLKQRK